MTNHLFDPLFGRHAENDAPFLMLEAGTLSYRAFVALSAQMANVFAELGLQKGDRVAVQTEKSATALAIYAACLRAGVILLPLNTAYTTQELAYFTADAEPALVICDPARVEAIRGILPAQTHVLTLDAAGHGTLAERAAMQPRDQTPVACGPTAGRTTPSLPPPPW